MKFDWKDWLREVIVGTAAGTLAALVAALAMPNAPVVISMLAGGLNGLIFALLSRPAEHLTTRGRNSSGKEKKP